MSSHVRTILLRTLFGALAVGAGVAVYLSSAKTQRDARTLMHDKDYLAARQAYADATLPALKSRAEKTCKAPDAGLMAALAGKFLYDSNDADAVQRELVARNLNPRHYGTNEVTIGDGYLSVERAADFAAYLAAENITLIAAEDKTGAYQAAFFNDGKGPKILVLYYPDPAPYRDQAKPKTVPGGAGPTPADSIQPHMSAEMGYFLHDLMEGKMKSTGAYVISRKPDPAAPGWTIRTLETAGTAPRNPCMP